MYSTGEQPREQKLTTQLCEELGDKLQCKAFFKEIGAALATTMGLFYVSKLRTAPESVINTALASAVGEAATDGYRGQLCFELGIDSFGKPTATPGMQKVHKTGGKLAPKYETSGQAEPVHHRTVPMPLSLWQNVPGVFPFSPDRVLTPKQWSTITTIWYK